jgi:hypothetical protein
MSVYNPIVMAVLEVAIQERQHISKVWVAGSSPATTARMK